MNNLVSEANKAQAIITNEIGYKSCEIGYKWPEDDEKYEAIRYCKDCCAKYTCQSSSYNPENNVI